MTLDERSQVIGQIASSRGSLLDVIQLAGGFARNQAQRDGHQTPGGMGTAPRSAALAPRAPAADRGL